MRRAVSRFGVGVLLAVSLASSAGAQIISTSVPKDTGGAAAKNWNLHVMAGYTRWDIGELNDQTFGEPGSGSGGKNGGIVAADVAVRAGDALTVNVGGWFNKLQPFKLPGEGLSISRSTAISSGYGSVSFKGVGVQAGIVHYSHSWAFASAFANVPAPADFDESVNDFDAFATYRRGGTAGNDRQWSFSVGAGLFRAAAVGDLPASTSFSGFGNASLGLYKGLSVDAAYWYIGNQTVSYQDENGSRMTVGIGYTF